MFDLARVLAGEITFVRADGACSHDRWTAQASLNPLVCEDRDFAQAPGFLADLAIRRRHTLQAVFTFPGQAPA